MRVSTNNSAAEKYRVTSGGRRVALAVLLLVLYASACGTSSSSTTDSAIGGPTASTPVAPTEVAATDPTPIPESATPVPAPTAQVEDADIAPTPQPSATPVPAPPEVVGPAFRTDAIFGFDPDAQHAYAATTDAWGAPTACDADPIEALAGLVVDDALAGKHERFEAGLLQAGDVRQLVFNEAGEGVVASSCGEFGSAEWWMQTVTFDDAGRVAETGAVIPLVTEDGERDVPWVMSWYDTDSVVVRALAQDDDDWFVQDSITDPATGDVAFLESYEDQESYITPSAGITTSNGDFTFREIRDPDGSIGCEGIGAGATIEVDNGETKQLALGANGSLSSTVDDLHFGPSQLVAWTSGCEGYGSAYVGRYDNDGLIFDAHYIDTTVIVGDRDVFYQFQYYRLTKDSTLVALGVNSEGETSTVELFSYDLASDPHFVETLNPTIDTENPLALMLDGSGFWYSGETLGANPACGGTTLYGDTPHGYARAFDANTEIDTIVKMVASDAREGSYGDITWSSRSIVVATECPGEYEGLKLYFGEEPENLRYGLYLTEADMPEITDVLSVREVVAPEADYADAVFAEVVLADGTVTEIELTSA